MLKGGKTEQMSERGNPNFRADPANARETGRLSRSGQPPRIIPLAVVDKRKRLGRRVEELRSIYLAALGGPALISPMKATKVDAAAQLVAIAEAARGAFLNDCQGSLDDIVRIERKADAAVRSLGIVDAKPAPGPTLAEHLARRAAERAAAGRGST